MDWEQESDCLEQALTILRDPDCTLATASYLFWACNPADYLTCNLARLEPEDDPVTGWSVVRDAVLRAAKGGFRPGIAYDPNAEWDTAVRVTPASLCCATSGVDPVVWRDSKDVGSWWPDQLANEIDSATDAEDLFNIATHLDTPESLRLILDSPQLDQGTALLAYWRLRKAQALWTAAAPLVVETESILLAEKLPHVLRYDPSADPANGRLARPSRWTIPTGFLLPTK